MSSKATDVAALPYARHASPAFNARMRNWLAALAGEVRGALGENLAALVLGGGYGRGEGGILRVSGEERPYNDLDLVLVVRRKTGLPWKTLNAIRHNYEELIGIDVDFSRPLTAQDIQNWPATLMWTDLLHGHCVLDGPADILTANAPALRTEKLALIEATRLLLNRGAGVLWSLRVLHGLDAAPDADFIRRNAFKCGLAMGDAVLIAHGRFMTPYTGRGPRLAELVSELPLRLSFDLKQLYDDALRFKFWPDEGDVSVDRPKVAALAKQWGEILLYVENRRAGHAWRNLDDYCESAELREPEQNAIRQWPRNLVRNRQLGRWSLRYPRERLYRELPVLLGLCATMAEDWPSRSAEFLAIWKRVN